MLGQYKVQQVSPPEILLLYTRDSTSVHSLSHVCLFVTPWTVARQASLSITNSWSLLKFMSIKSVMPSNHFILCCPLLLLKAYQSNLVTLLDFHIVYGWFCTTVAKFGLSTKQKIFTGSHLIYIIKALPTLHCTFLFTYLSLQQDLNLLRKRDNLSIKNAH